MHREFIDWRWSDHVTFLKEPIDRRIYPFFDSAGTVRSHCVYQFEWKNKKWYKLAEDILDLNPCW
jgi:hypothetical protein